MNRREFFRRGLPGVAMAALPIAAAKTESDLPDETFVDGISVRWLGWRDSPSQDMLYGVWVMGPVPAPPLWDGDNQIGLYSTTGGGVSTYRPGEVFDTSIKRGYPLVTSQTSQLEKDRIRRDAYNSLMQVFRLGVDAWQS